MGWAALSLVVWSALAHAVVSDHTLVYYNARLALREGHATEAVKLWLLRNALEAQTGTVSAHDADFHSVAWAALSDLGLCADGLDKDTDGAGLWPLAVHNQIVRTRGRGRPQPLPRTFDTLDVGQQQRRIAIGDVLGAEELDNVRLSRGRCLRPWQVQVAARQGIVADKRDRQVTARMLRHLLVASRETLHDDRVKGRSVVEARIFDLDLQLTALAAREARKMAQQDGRWGAMLGLSRRAVDRMQLKAPATTLAWESEAARILRACVAWPVDEWMALSPDRRLFLFDSARAQDDAADAAIQDAMNVLAIGIVDELITAGDGAEVERWLARVAEDRRTEVWQGDRGQRLLGLDRTAGFRERSVIALHRGVDNLERGDVPAALRALAFALQNGDESRASEDVARLARRWLAHAAGRFALTDELLVTLQELVPRREYTALLEDLMWRAALLADEASYARGQRHTPGRSAVDRRLGLLAPLARGDLGAFSRGIGAGMDMSASETLRFLDELVQRIEREDGAVRVAHVPTLTAVQAHVAPLLAGAGTSGRAGRTAAELMQRTQAIVEGVGALPPEATPEQRARALAPGSEVFAGSVRLAPVDVLPWPFAGSTPAAPSVFAPLELVPVEWRADDGHLVFGWSISESPCPTPRCCGRVKLPCRNSWPADGRSCGPGFPPGPAGAWTGETA